MCGLIGLIDPMLDDNVMPTLLDSIYHRGPDGEGRHQHGKLRMGMRRLAVIDIAGGGQPQFAWSDRIVAFQNGEIYNYRELRDELKERELICRTKTDTEVIALGYTAWGIEGLLQRLDGMFALAILDKNRHELHLARDRFGEKPLFYASVGGCFAYGSDLVTLASLPWVNREIDRLGLARYLALHFIPGDRTILTGINRVLPGERLVVRIDDGRVQRHRYWRPQPNQARTVSDDELADAIERAVRSRLVADVPVGVFLSGGVDSATVAAIAAKHHPGIKTFSIGFDDPKTDESAHAQAVARHIGATHHHFRFARDSFARLLPAVAGALDEPIGDQAALPLFWLSQETRRHVTAALSGEGADEIFAGYGYYRRFAPSGRWQAWRRRWFGHGEAHLPTQLINDDALTTPSGFPLIAEAQLRAALLGGSLPAGDAWEEDWSQWLGTIADPLQRAEAADATTWLADDLLVKLDRMAMIHSLEGRAPYLAPELAIMALSLPAEQRMCGMADKIALRRVAARWLPADIATRPKQGFVLPMRDWLAQEFTARGGPAAFVQAGPLPGLDGDALAQVISDDLARGVERERLLLALLMLVEWWRSFSARQAILAKRVAASKRFVA